MRILSFNMWGKFKRHEERWSEAIKCLPAVQADIICLQEAACAKLLGELVDSTKLNLVISDCDSTGLAILAKYDFSSADIVEYKTRSPIETYVRKFQHVAFMSGKQKFFVINTHLSWKKDDDKSRAGQAAELAGFALTTQNPTVFCGDFNTEYQSDSLKPLREAKIRDVLANTEFANKPTWDNANPFIQSHAVKFPNRRIDLILANAAFLHQHPLEDARIIFDCPQQTNSIHLSDHYAVQATFK